MPARSFAVTKNNWVSKASSYISMPQKVSAAELAVESTVTNTLTLTLQQVSANTSPSLEAGPSLHSTMEHLPSSAPEVASPDQMDH